jgi:type III pantothenate kinase
MVFAVDIGNTNLVFGISSGGTWVHTFRIATKPDESYIFYEIPIREELLELGIRLSDISRIIISSVVPSLTRLIQSLTQSLFLVKPVIVTPSIYPALGIEVSNPSEIGTDLFANAVAAFNEYRKTSIIVDFGTALTFTTVTDKGKLIGVSIAPGLRLAVNVLSTKTAQLPEVHLSYPDSVIGKDTWHAIQSGVLHGYTGLVRHMISQTEKEMGEPLFKIATGGMSAILNQLDKDFDIIDPKLTLKGLLFIADAVVEDG